MGQESHYDNLKELCARRRSVRRFTSEHLSIETIGAIRTIAQSSPYASGKKNWELLVVTDSTLIRDLGEIVKVRSGELAARMRDDFRGLFLQYADNFTLFESAPALFIPTFKVQHTLTLMLEQPGEEIVCWERDNYIKSIGCVTMLVLLAAESLGLGGCCMTGPLIAEEELAQRIGVKTGHSIGAFIPVGYPQGGY